MKIIFKYELNYTAYLDIPEEAEFLSVQNVNNKICLYFIVNPDNKLKKRGFTSIPTGRDIYEKNLKYLGTVQLPENRSYTCVLHVFEVLGD